jgi:hypothetical protein
MNTHFNSNKDSMVNSYMKILESEDKRNFYANALHIYIPGKSHLSTFPTLLNIYRTTVLY